MFISVRHRVLLKLTIHSRFLGKTLEVDIARTVSDPDLLNKLCNVKTKRG
jgi:hypothetical protein